MPVTSEEIITPNWYKETTGDHDHVLLSSIPKDGGWKITKFETTPPMSSYIVAYANGHFKYLEDSVVLPLSGKELPLRIYSGQLPHQSTVTFVENSLFSSNCRTHPPSSICS